MPEPAPAISVFASDLEPVDKLARKLAGRPTPQTLVRWAAQGMPARRIGRKTYTTPEAVEWFLKQRAEARQTPAKPVVKSRPAGTARREAIAEIGLPIEPPVKHRPDASGEHIDRYA